jgi:hypothetical protein
MDALPSGSRGGLDDGINVTAQANGVSNETAGVYCSSREYASDWGRLELQALVARDVRSLIGMTYTLQNGSASGMDAPRRTVIV